MRCNFPPSTYLKSPCQPTIWMNQLHPSCYPRMEMMFLILVREMCLTRQVLPKGPHFILFFRVETHVELCLLKKEIITTLVCVFASSATPIIWPMDESNNIDKENVFYQIGTTKISIGFRHLHSFLTSTSHIYLQLNQHVYLYLYFLFI